MGPPPPIGTAFGFPADNTPVGVVYVYFQALDLQEWFDTTVRSQQLTCQCFHSYNQLLQACLHEPPAVLWVDRADVMASLATWLPDLADMELILTRDKRRDSLPLELASRVRLTGDPHEFPRA